MYWEYFGFEENPFSISPDPRYLFMSKRHQEALAHLLYGVREGGGFVLLTGEVGTGKTTLCRSLIDDLPEQIDLAFVLNPRVDEVELLATICDEFAIPYMRETATLKGLVDRLNDHLLDAHARGRQPVLLIDEAQNLSPAVLEQVRLLTNLETAKRKLLQIVLIGQPELNELLRRRGLRQLDQRITARYHLKPLTLAETDAYIRHRLQVAGGSPGLFTAGAVRMVYRYSGGVPRLINTICDRSLLGAYAGNRPVVDARLVRGAAREVIGEEGRRRRNPAWFLAGVGTAAAIMIAGLILADPLGLGLAPDLGFLLFRPAAEPTAASDPAGEPASATVAVAEPEAARVAPPMPAASAATAPARPAPRLAAAPTPPALAGANPVAMAGAHMAPTEPPATVLAALAPAPRPAPAAAAAPSALPAADVELAAIAPSVATDALAEAQPTLDDLIGRGTVQGDMEAALETLFERWRLDFRALKGITPCKKARYANLRCLQAEGDWHDLRLANLPAMITLRQAGGEPIQVTLLQLGDERALVAVDGRMIRTTLADLSSLWTGEYLLLWRPLFDYSRELHAGLEGSDVAWVRKGLAKLSGKTVPDAKTARFDDSLVGMVRAFQREQGLQVDGIVGSRTLIQISRSLDREPSPSLR